jgi:hypothetical protein
VTPGSMEAGRRGAELAFQLRRWAEHRHGLYLARRPVSVCRMVRSCRQTLPGCPESAGWR